MTSGERILVIAPSWIGDMVIAQSLFKKLTQDDAGRRIDVVAPPWSLPLLQRMPEVNRGFELAVGHGEFGLRRRYRVGTQLRSRNINWAIVLPRSFKSALIPWFAGIPKRTGYLGEHRYGLLNDIRASTRQRLPMMAQRYLALAQSGQDTPVVDVKLWPKLVVDDVNRETLLDRLHLRTHDPVIALAPGAQYGPAKQWPVERFATLAKHLIRNGQRVWLMGSPQDEPIAQRIAVACDGRASNLCGKTQLQDAIDLMSYVRCVVSNDSGLMHIAAALERPLVAVYGSSQPVYTPPLGDAERIRIVYLGLDCSPCFKRRCPFGHYNCLRQIEVARVIGAVHDLV